MHGLFFECVKKWDNSPITLQPCSTIMSPTLLLILLYCSYVHSLPVKIFVLYKHTLHTSLKSRKTKCTIQCYVTLCCKYMHNFGKKNVKIQRVFFTLLRAHRCSSLLGFHKKANDSPSLTFCLFFLLTDNMHVCIHRRASCWFYTRCMHIRQ